MSEFAEIRRKLAKLMVPGVVVERDHVKGVRFDMGQGFLSSWVQPPDQNKGTRSRWLPQIGSQHLLLTMPGSEQVTSFVPMSHHDNSQNPAANADQTVLYDDGTSRVVIGGGVVELRSGSSSILIEDGKIVINGNILQHNAKNIGDSHKHLGVQPGGGITDVPV